MKKALSLLLVFMMVLGLFVPVAYAAGNEKTAVIVVDTTALPDVIEVGDEISVPVKITENPGFASYVLKAVWDADCFDAMDPLYTVGTVCHGSFLAGTEATMASAVDTTETGTLFTLNLKAKKAVIDSEITVTTDFEGGSISDEDDAYLSLSATAGKVSVHSFEDGVCADCGALDSTVKFYAAVTSGDTIDVVVDNNYKAILRLPENGKVNTGSVTGLVMMQNVASLGVDGTRSYELTIDTGSALGSYDVDLKTWLENAYGFEGATINAVIDGNEVAYTADKIDADGKITATADTEAARAAWQALTAHVETSTQTADDSNIEIVNGSYAKIGTEYLHFENEEGNLVLDNANDMDALSAAIRNAVVLDTCDDTEGKLVIGLKKGTKVAVGQSIATLTDDATITVEADADEMAVLEGKLTALRDAADAYTLVKELVTAVNDVIGAVDNSEEVNVTIHFCKYDQNVEDDKYLKTPATCTTNAVYYMSCECGEMGTETFEGGKAAHTFGEWTVTKEATCTEDGSKTRTCPVCTETETETIPALGHKFADGVCTVCGALDTTVKFYAAVTSGDTVDVVVDNNYTAILRLPENGKVNTGSVTGLVMMQNVASLGVDGTRSYELTIDTGSALGSHDVDLKTWLANAYGFEGATINAVIDGSEVTYEVAAFEDGKIVATADTEAARTAWQALTSHVETSTQAADDSNIEIANGSYAKIGTEYLHFETEDGNLVLDNVNDIDALNAAIRNAVVLDTCDDTEGKIIIGLKKGTKLAVGQSIATLADDATITVEADADEMAALEGKLTALRDAEDVYTLVKELVSAVNDVIGVADASEEVNVTIHFCKYDQKVEDDKYLKTPATCTTNAVYYMSCECGEMGTETFEGGKAAHTFGEWTVTKEATCTEDGSKTRTCPVCTETETETIPALGHKFADGVCTVCGALDTTVKFYAAVTSGDTVDVIVDNNYTAILRLPENGKVNTGSVTGLVMMQNVASLGVDGTRSYELTIDTGSALGSHDVDLKTWLENAYGFEGATINAVIDGNEVTYEVAAIEDGKIVATADTEAARTAWQALTSHVETSTQATDDSNIEIVNGSYIKIGTEYLHFETEDGNLVLDNVNDMDALNAAIRNAVMLDTCDDTEGKIIIGLKKGTKLAVGQSIATLKDDMNITVEADADEMAVLEGKLTALRDAEDVYTLVKELVSAVNDVIGVADNSDEVNVTIHCHDLTKVDAKAATCAEAGNNEYYFCAVCEKAYKDADATIETTVEDETLAALEAVFGTPTYTWEGSVCTAKIVCTVCNGEAEGHTVTETAEGKGVVKTPATYQAKGTTTYTVTFTDSRFTSQTIDIEDIDKLEHHYMLGDVDFDGKITAADSRLALRMAVLVDPCEPDTDKFLAADVNFDGKITSEDSRLILRAAVGIDNPNDWIREYKKLKLGDVDFDGKITAADARLALRIAVKMDPCEYGTDKFVVTDVDFDEKLTAADARRILRGAVLLEDPDSWENEKK